MSVITNYALNPSAEYATINPGYSAYTAGTVTKDATEHADGSNSAKYVSTGVNQFEGLRCFSVTTSFTGAADLVIATIELKGTGTLNLPILRAGYTDVTKIDSSSQLITLTGTFTKYTWSVTLDPAKTCDSVQLLLLRDETPAAFTLYADKFLIVKGLAVAPDYFDGDTTDTDTDVYAWAGTAHGSESTWTHTDLTPTDPIPRRTLNVRTNALLRR